MNSLDDIRPGATIGRFEFLVPIAKGGMAAVWAARLKGSRGFSKTVAIKTMLPMLSDDPMFEQMFLDEAQIAALIHHPNVVEIMDLGEQDGILFQVMEYVDGESLATVLRTQNKKKERIPLEIAVQIIIDACRGLHAAHELKNVDGTLLGLVHRDISPQNIMITYDGVVKLVDFGVAKAAGRTTSETTAGQIKGKAPYMAPEQALGQHVDRRTDVFAMGIVLYQITTGKHPFRGENDIATLHNILHNDLPSPRFVDPQFPRPLESAIHRALSRDITQRFASAKDMADALSRVFPPTRRRTDVADVGTFVQNLLGESGNRRRMALAEAIKRADLRTSSTPLSEASGPILLPLAELGTDSAIHSPRGLAAPTERIDVGDLSFNRPSQQPHPPNHELPPPPDAHDPIRTAQTIRPGSGEYAVVSSPSDDPLPHFDDEILANNGLNLIDSSGSIPTTDSSPPPKSRWPKTAFILGTTILGIGAGITGWVVLQPQSPPATAPTASTNVSPEAAPIATAPIADDAPADYTIDALSSAAPEDADTPPTMPPSSNVWIPKSFPPSHPHPTTTAVSVAPSATPPKPTAAPTSTAPTTTATSTWKPPPVSDPGF
ncbi:MAG TPA: serine/threonine-protein kinase [Polyangiaceae bacterium]|jgi:serine/threonine-protein kinase|nr:serine/threonine-protein kinase [Polyangiaceae bacterium]HNZ23808.1 serine/threonine-protein kinase [Polyangiaceae bacterium]HOD25323.1 serine/threonine-protein kinase [Polyangiaceae bacterium]HOE51896.1 serine/threonine-protein kinase [Polyangiaceae bacterium]HOH01576.1 serine/threonine-protein kinase [Polyangiaceae bacterium]